MTEAPDIGITLHALRRYIERVVSFRAFTSDDGQVVANFEHSTGQSREMIESLIRSDVLPRLPVTVLHNRSRRVIRGETARFVVDRGMVITCWKPDEEEEAA